MPLNRNAFCGTSPMRAQTSSRRTARTSAPSIVSAPAGHVVEARDEVDERGLAAARAADDGRRLARLDDERDVAQDRVLGARVAELDVAELEAADGRRGRERLVRVLDRGLRPEDLLDPPRRDDGPRDHHEHEDGHHHREQDLHDVLQERDQVADRHLAAVDPDAAEPQDRDRRQVEDRHQQRDHHREHPVDPERGRGQVAVRDVEALLLVLRADERADDADAAERLAGDLVDAVDLDLHRLEERQRPGHERADDEGHDRQDHDQDARQRDVLAERHDDPADRQDRGDDHHVQAQQDDHLDLLDVVRVAGDERRRPEPVELGLGEALDLAEDRRRRSRPNAIPVFEPQ